MKIARKFKKWHYTLGLLLLLIFYIAGNAASICIYSTKDETQNADTAIILGAAATDEGVSPVFRERINHGIWLYQNGYVQKLIITGGYGDGNLYSDSYIGKQYAIGQGIPDEAILLEEASTITEENLENAMEVMKNNGYDTALIVSDPLHMKRAMLMAQDKGLKAYTSPTHTSMYKSIYEKAKFTAREVFFYIGYKFSSLFSFSD
ncbi:MAG: YdcF family protein [Lachnospiraceae bacterium]|nr:YdcF family protein [Lachnospiraceae bacterium]